MADDELANSQIIYHYSGELANICQHRVWCEMAKYPADPKFCSVGLELEFSTDSNHSANGYGQVASRDGMGISASIKYHKLTYREALRVRSFTVGLRGFAKICDLTLLLAVLDYYII